MKILKFIWMIVCPNFALELWTIRKLKARWANKDASRT